MSGRAAAELAFVAPGKLVPWPRNPRRHDEAQVAALARSIERFGFGAPVVARPSDGRVLAGHGRLAAATLLGLARVPVRWLELGDADAAALALADNRLQEQATWDDPALAALLDELRAADAALPALAGFDAASVDALLAEVAAANPAAGGVTPTPPEAEAVPDPAQVEARAQPGDLWALGRHRLLCADATDPAAVARLLDGAKPDAVLTDPPYCSGGFQDAGRAAGSKGTDAKGYKAGDVRNDTLSARGFQSLIRAALAAADARAVYVFTDWRMWVYLFDVVEALGYGVRNMLVWDKGSPGMGVGWRAQHELILFGTREGKLWGDYPKKGMGGFGNVLQVPRTGNVHHVTEKPVDLLRQVLACSTWAARVADPFAGSGSTLLACELEGRTGYGAELEPKIADVVLARWEGLTGGKAARVAAAEA